MKKARTLFIAFVLSGVLLLPLGVRAQDAEETVEVTATQSQTVGVVEYDNASAKADLALILALAAIALLGVYALWDREHGVRK
ncbi:MAG: hypothetical protein WCV86_02200 [Patescibacteria group bacterium]|jgi:hypothetical protein